MPAHLKGVETQETIDAIAQETGIVVGRKDPLLALDVVFRRQTEATKLAHEALVRNFRKEIADAEARVLEVSKKVIEASIIASIQNAEQAMIERASEIMSEIEMKARAVDHPTQSSPLNARTYAVTAVLASAITFLALYFTGI